MRRWQQVTAGLTGIVLGVGLALGGASSASATPAGHWGGFTVSGASKAYTGTMTMPGFPATSFTSNASQATVISGASTWQSAATGPGALYGSSRGNTYINQRPNANNAGSPSTTTYTFDGLTPAGSWSFVLGDIDADQATISATVQGGGAATAADIGFQPSTGTTDRGYNSCSVSSPGGPSCTADPDGTTGLDAPTWVPSAVGAPTAGTLIGNATASDTAGATAWFTPTVPLESLTISYQWRSGFPVYQTWFASRTAAISGTATLDGTPLPGSTVTVTAPRGTTYTTTTAADGTYSFPNLPQIGGYLVEIAPPAGSAPLDQTGTVSLVGQDGVADRAFTAPADTTSVIGTVTDEDGNPAANVPVVITDPATPDAPPLVDTTTNSDGVYTGSGLPPETALEVVVDGGEPTTITTGEVGAAPVEPAPIVAPPAAVATVSGTVTLDGTPVAAGAVVDLLDADGNVLDSTTTAADGTYSLTTVPGSYTVRTAAPSDGADGPTTLTVVTTSGDVANADFPFTTPVPPAPQVVDQPGTVTDSNGDPAAGVAVVATPVDPDSGDPVTATTGDDGTFDLVGLNPTSDYTVVAGTDEQASDPQVITTADVGETPTPIEIVVPAPVTVDQPGTVTDTNGDPAAGVEVVATPTDPDAGDPVTTTTDSDGAFDLTGLEPSTSYSIVAGSGDTTSDPQVVVTPATGSGTPLTFVVAAAAVTPTPTPTPTTPPVTGGTGTTPISSGGGSLAFTGADIAPAAIAAGILVLLGAGLITFRTARNRRRSEHLQD